MPALLSWSLWIERLPQAFLFISPGSCLPPYLHTKTQLFLPVTFAPFARLPPYTPSPKTLAPLDNLAWHPHRTQGILGGFFFYSMHTDTIFTKVRLVL